MTHRLTSLPLLLAMALALPACGTFSAGSVTTSTPETMSTHSTAAVNGQVTQDRTITATCSSGGSLQGVPEDCTMTLGATTIHVTPAEITWKDGSLQLPSGTASSTSTHTTHSTTSVNGQVTEDRTAKWSEGSLQLPATWKNLAFTESSGTIDITLDGAPFATIRPD